MRWIPTLPFGAAGCSVFPYIGRDDDGFFDLQTDGGPPSASDFHAVSATAVKEMARHLGWASPQEHEDLRVLIEEAELEIQKLEDELKEADERDRLIDGLKKHGYQIGRVPGRPRKEKAA